ncbi:hypothetical protein COO60DRAFT_931819 [Scenedesmus sp. NREL 46B-D3]|nr:hypothetical protein COO60DRAFT_931819 [Scenedesmus sp. NREL 46B-D3]
MMALTVRWGGMLPTELSGMAWLRKQIAAVMDSVAAAAEGWKPDIILANQLAYGQVHVAEKLRVPLHILLTIPWLPTAAIPHPWARAWGANVTDYVNAAAEKLLAPGLALLSWFAPETGRRVKQAALARVAAAANWASTPLLDHTAWWGIADLMIGLRRRLGLPLLSANNTGSALYRQPTTCLFSTALVPRPPDWGSNVTLAGFLSLNDAAASSSWQPPEELLQFLGAGAPPIYVGFGSMVVQDPQQLVCMVRQAAAALPAGQRVILCTGWSGTAAAAAADAASGAAAAAADAAAASNGSAGDVRVLCIAEAPHEWLFPKCCSLVHHGGVGTTAAGLRCGKPTMVVPAFGDLFFFADVCHQLGVGPAPIPLPELTAQRLLAALQQLVAEQRRYGAAASKVADELRSEDGLAAAVASVARTLVNAK